TFDDASGALAACDTHRLKTPLLVIGEEVVDQRRHDARPGTAKRVAEGDGAAVRVELLGVDAQFADYGEGLGGEGLVEFDDVDVLDGLAGAFQHLGDRGDGANAHDLRVTACYR